MKNKILTAVCVCFAVFFLGLVFNLTRDISHTKRNLLKSDNVLDVTNLISTKIKISKDDFPQNGEWTRLKYNDADWKDVKIPSHQLVQEPDYEIGKKVYYRIVIPKEVTSKLSHLKNESSIALYYIHFKHLDISINGKFYISNNPQNAIEKVVLLPIVENRDNIIAIEGDVSEGDSGIDHRDPILIGRTAELNELYRVSYKGSTVFPLIFILSKGSIIFVFVLIYLLLNVDKSFEKFLFFGFCTIIEELIAADYLYGPLTFNQMLYLYNLVNIGSVCAVSLFFLDLLNLAHSKFKIRILALLLTAISFLVAFDALFWGTIFDISSFMKFWNVVTAGVMLYFLPRMLKEEKILFGVMCVSITLYLWSALFSNNVGLNMKAYGNLLLFFVVAYQTFALFRREQLKLRDQDKKLIEQEKDVAIANTARFLAHDVRKPLELMQILLTKMSSGEVTKEFLDSARKDIDFSIANVSYQVSDIINFSKESNIKLFEVSFYRVLSASLRQVMAIHPELKINLEYEFNNQNKILADESRLSGALINLLANAVEAIKDLGGKSQGVIRFSTIEHSGKFIFNIYNDGPHIPEDAKELIFKPLYSKGKCKGTGLGLSSVLKSIEDHKGTIVVKNCPQGGVEFSITLNMSSAPDEINVGEFLNHSSAYSYEEKEISSQVHKSPFRLFLLEDDAQTAQYFNFLINKLPFEVSFSVASSYDEAVDLVQKQRFDLYILDYDLNSMKNGLDFFKEHLSFLSKEVVFHANRDLYDSSELPCKFLKKPISLFDLEQICNEAYLQRMKILFVDDTKLIRIAWANYHGTHNLIQAASPEEALAVFKEKQEDIDICVLDFHFENSKITGEELAKKIMAIRQNVKIVIASSVDQGIDSVTSISKRDFEVRKL